MEAEATIITQKVPAYPLFSAIREMAPLLSEQVQEEEKGRRLSRPVLDALRSAGLLKLFTPKSLGGLELDPLTVARLVEEVARHNTAAGWCMMVANTATWWGAGIPDKGIEEIYARGADTLMAGAFHPPMQATITEGGYLINGRSPLTSNVHEADWIFVTAFVMEDGQMRMHEGIPEVIGVCMNPADCRILDTWDTIGMKATDSNDVEAANVFVPQHRSLPLAPGLPPNSYYQAPLYRYPAIGAGVAALIAPVALAVARNAITELKTLAGKKVPFGSIVPMNARGSVQKKLGQAEAYVQSARVYLHHTLAECWRKTAAGEPVTLEDKANMVLAATHTNQTCAQAVDLVYSAAGTTGIYNRNKLAHYFTDAQVIRQHGFANDSRYETAAQLYLGLPPDLPVVTF